MEEKPVFSAEERARFSWLVTQYERNTERYMAHEKFLLELARLPWWKRLFLGSKILTYLAAHLRQYPAPRWPGGIPSLKKN